MKQRHALKNKRAERHVHNGIIYTLKVNFG